MTVRGRRTTLIALVVVLLAIFLPAASAAVSVTVSDDRDVDPVPVFIDGDLVVFAPRADQPVEAKNGDGATTGVVTRDGFSTFGDVRALDRYEIRLVASAGIESIRPHLESAVRDAGGHGLAATVAPGTTDALAPATGQIDVVVSDRSPCSGSWLACGGPMVVDGVAQSGRMWVNPRLLQRPGPVIVNTIRHEVGHTVGLAHYDAAVDGERQVMHTARFDAQTYRRGDAAGLAFLRRPDPTVEVSSVRYVAGRYEVRGAVHGVPADGRLRVSADTEVSSTTAREGSFVRSVPAGAGSHAVCVELLDAGSVLGRNCGRYTAPGDPFGEINSLRVSGPTLVVDGWAIDPQTAEPITISVVVDGVGTSSSADRSRPDVGNAHRGYGDDHGFRVTRVLLPGTHEVCVVARNVGGGSDARLGCGQVSA